MALKHVKYVSLKHIKKFFVTKPYWYPKVVMKILRVTFSRQMIRLLI